MKNAELVLTYEALSIRASAIMLEAEAMRTLNKERELNRYSLGYGEESFQELADRLHGISADLLTLRDSITGRGVKNEVKEEVE